MILMLVKNTWDTLCLILLDHFNWSWESGRDEEMAEEWQRLFILKGKKNISCSEVRGK